MKENYEFKIPNSISIYGLVLSACKNDDDPQPYEDDFTSRSLPAVVANTNPKVFVKYEQQTTTLETLTRVDSKGELYRMDYTADYGLDELIASGGVKSNAELLGYVQAYLLNFPSGPMMLDNGTMISDVRHSLSGGRITTFFSAEISIMLFSHLSVS